MINQELVEYIKQQMNLGVSKNKIVDVLLGQGWHQAELDEAFAIAEGAKTAPAKTGNNDVGDFADTEQEDKNPKFGRQAVLLVIAGVAALAILVGAAIFYLPLTKTNEPVASDSLTNQPAKPADITSTASQDKDAGNADAANAQNQKNAADLALVNELEGLIQAPVGWLERKGIKNSRPLLAFFKPDSEKDASGKVIFNEFINITRVNIKTGGISGAADYLAKAKKSLQSTIQDYKLISEKQVNLGDGSPATLIGASFTKDGVALKSMQLFAFKGDYAYLVTGVVLASNWDKEKDIIGTSVMSLKLPAN